MKLVAVISFLTYILLGSPPLFADTGSLYVTSNPSGANISLDNNPTGKKTETFIENIPTGTHNIG